MPSPNRDGSGGGAALVRLARDVAREHTLVQQRRAAQSAQLVGRLDRRDDRDVAHADGGGGAGGGVLADEPSDDPREDDERRGEEPDEDPPGPGRRLDRDR